MDHDIEDLESLFSDHFGRTPVSTPWGSQEAEIDSDPNLSIVSEEEDDPVLDIEQRARDYLEAHPVEDRDGEIVDEEDRAVSGGQNKNQFVVGYFMWRVMTGRHRMIEYQMQVPGHARCHVDAGFAAIKRLHRRSDTDCMDQLEQVVNRSSITNHCVRYPAWTWRDWKSFLRPCFKALMGIRKYQYFRFSQEQPGIVIVKQSSDADEQAVDIRISPDLSFHEGQLPEEILPGGLTQARQKYLYTSVRPFVRPAFQDTTCPLPRQEDQ